MKWFPKLLFSAELFVICLLAVCGYAQTSALAAPTNVTYFVSAQGDDHYSGTDAEHPFKTVQPLQSLGPLGSGCKVLFEGTQTFVGPLTMQMTGTVAAPCVLGSYGKQPATMIDAAPFESPICTLRNSEYVTVEHLRFVGTPGTNYPGPDFKPVNKGIALSITSARASGAAFKSVTVKNCEFRNTNWGLWIDSETKPGLDGFDGVSVTNNLFDSVYQFGCYVTGFGRIATGPVDQLHNVYVGNNDFRNIKGNPHYGSEAQPLSVSGATGIVIEKNKFENNCGFGAPALTNSGGSTALSVSNCRDFQIQYNEVFGTRCALKFDGSAIDADQDSQNGEICYNLTYDNSGPSIQAGSFRGVLSKNISIHHNISINDVRGSQKGSTQGAIRLWGNCDTIQIFNNTIYVDKAGSIGFPSALSFEVGNNLNIRVINNIFKTTGGIPMIRCDGTLAGEDNATHIDRATKFIANCYDSSGDPLVISTDDTRGSYKSISSLQEWHALNQEKSGQILQGVCADAGLLSPTNFASPDGGYLPSHPVGEMKNCDLKPSSTCIGKGIDILPWVTLAAPIKLQTQDYHGAPLLSANTGVDIGAVQH